MPIPTPFHSRTSQLCTSMKWKDWAGYYSVCSYDTSHEPEYFAIRHAAGLIDVSPLFKYEIRGPDAAAFLSRATVKDVRKLKVGRVTYLCWCDDQGKVVDDGTVSRLEENHFRLTAADPSLSWFDRLRRGFDVEIEDCSDAIGALALQGPTSREILSRVTGADLSELRFFAVKGYSLADAEVWISRTGYTGDLGFEIWVDAEDAVAVYDALMEEGRDFGIMPTGLDALDVSRIEASFIMNGVDYYSSIHCLIEDRKSSPFELGLDWTVKLDRDPFIGQRALQAEKAAGSRRRLVGLEIDWEGVESLFDGYGLPPELPTSAWRDTRPVYDTNKEWIGQATSGVWSPTLKRNLALAQVPPENAAVGEELLFEVTAEYRRHTVSATVAETPFFNPERKRS